MSYFSEFSYHTHNVAEGSLLPASLQYWNCTSSGGQACILNIALLLDVLLNITENLG